MSLSRALVDDISIQNNFFMVMCIYVRGPTLARLAMVLVLLSIGNTPALRVTLQAGKPLLYDFEPAVNRQPGFRRELVLKYLFPASEAFVANAHENRKFHFFNILTKSHAGC